MQRLKINSSYIIIILFLLIIASCKNVNEAFPNDDLGPIVDRGGESVDDGGTINNN